MPTDCPADPPNTKPYSDDDCANYDAFIAARPGVYKEYSDDNCQSFDAFIAANPGRYKVYTVDVDVPPGGCVECCGACVQSDCVVTCDQCNDGAGNDIPVPCDLTFTIASPDCSILNFTVTLRDVDPLTKNWSTVSPPPAPVTGGPGVLCEFEAWNGPAAITWSCPNFGGAQVNLDSSVPTLISCCPLHLQWTGGVVTTSGDPDCACIGSGPPNPITVTIDVTGATLNWCLKVCAGDGSCVYVCSDDCQYTHVGQVVFSGGVTTTVWNGPFWSHACESNCPCGDGPLMMAPAPGAAADTRVIPAADLLAAFGPALGAEIARRLGTGAGKAAMRGAAAALPLPSIPPDPAAITPACPYRGPFVSACMGCGGTKPERHTYGCDHPDADWTLCVPVPARDVEFTDSAQEVRSCSRCPLRPSAETPGRDSASG